jgi:hypothetical protein
MSDSNPSVWNSFLFTTAYDSHLAEVQEFFATLKRRGATFSHLGKTEYRLFVPDHLPVQKFIDVLQQSDCIYWIDDKVEVKTYCPTPRG